MSTIPVQIILHGLIALVPVEGAVPPNHMTALLVDARELPSEATPSEKFCFAPHVPEVIFPLTDKCPREAGCQIRSSGTLCACKLTNQEIRIEPGADPASTPLAY